MSIHGAPPQELTRAPAQGAAGADPANASAFATRARARLDRLLKWEFWPSWAVYAPLLPWVAWLTARNRGRPVFTAANPGMALGGFVGESKWETLSKLPAGAAVPGALIVPRETDARCTDLREAMARAGLRFPLILKPDVGERGGGVRLVRSPEQARAYLETHPGAVIAQRYHPGPFEAGVFYVREPGTFKGRVFSITDKYLPVLVGDGRSTVRALIWKHPRCRAQAGVFLERLGAGADRVPLTGEPVSLGVVGNHCQGAMFRDGAHLNTPELTAAFDLIARRVEGFYFGRFDARYSDVGEFKAGRGFEIVELNGVLSESTNIYDPAMGFWAGQRVLREQWRLAFAIGEANRRLGSRSATWVELFRAVRDHGRRPGLDRRAD